MALTPEQRDKVVPAPPLGTPMVDRSGNLTAAWQAWFIQSHRRMGGILALNNLELENQQQQDLTGIEADIDALQLLTASHTADLSALADELRSGPNL